MFFFNKLFCTNFSKQKFYKSFNVQIFQIYQKPWIKISNKHQFPFLPVVK